MEERKFKRKELEYKLLSSMLSRGSNSFIALKQVNFTADCIDDPMCRALFKEIEEFYSKGENIVISALPNEEFVKELIEIGVEKEAVPYLAKQIWDMIVTKDIENLLLTSSMHTGEDNEKVFAMFQDFIDKYEDLMYSKEDVHSMENCHKEAEDYQNDTNPTGIEPMIDGIHDKFRNGELILIGARPSVGKTATVTSIISALCKEKMEHNQMFFSLEQPKLQIYHRVLSNLTGIAHGIIENKKMTDGQRKVYWKASNFLKKRNKLFICDAPSKKATIEYILAVAKSMHKRHNLEIIYIDYIQRIRSRKKHPSRRDELAYISGELKDLAMELKIPVVILAQLSRDSEAQKKKGESTLPELRHIKDCGAIEQDIDQAYLLHRPNKQDVYLTMIHSKNRNGSVGEKKVVNFELHIQKVGGKKRD